MKTCCRCKVEKPMTDFYKNKSRKDGLGSLCKVCSAKNLIAYRAANKVHIKSNHRQHRAKNPDMYKAMAKRSREKNKESIFAARKAWATKNHQKVMSYSQSERTLLRDNYVKALLQDACGISRDSITNELIEAKRIHLQIFRKLKELKA